jgi:hypothetical protein
MNKIFVVLIIGFSLHTLTGQNPKVEFDGKNWVAPYALPAYSGWDIERFQIPISFAPKIQYQGIEDIRFTPGWGKKNSMEYWSYAFLWFLHDLPKLDNKIIEKNLQLYYTGLIASNIEPRKIPADKIFQTKASIKKIKTETGDLKTFRGTIYMLDYLEQKPITLNCKVHVRSCPELPNAFIFHEISPQPWTAEVWQNLNKLWEEFDCNTNGAKK